MAPIWFLGVLLTGFSLCQSDASLAESDETIGLVGRSLLNDYSELLESEASQMETNGLQKRVLTLPCGQPPSLKHGTWKMVGRTAIYKCNRGFAIVGHAHSRCMPNCRWQFPAPFCVAIYFGPRGNKGPQGPPGQPGPKGDNGKPGPRGWIGRNGADGAIGEPGIVGRPGRNGWTGAQGPHGLPGPRGDNGMNGAAGRKGRRGPPGPRGPMGPLGPQGPMGEKGDLGPIGAPGPDTVLVTSAFSAVLDVSNPSFGSPIVWQRIIYNGDGDLQPDSGIFIARIGGVYRITFILQIYSMNAYVVFKVNDVTVWSVFQPFSSYYEVASGSLVISLNKGDKVWLEIKDKCNGINKASCIFGHLIAPCM